MGANGDEPTEAYPPFPEDWEDWGLEQRRDHLDSLDLLPEDWEDTPPVDREAFLSGYDESDYESDVEDAGGIIDEDLDTDGPPGEVDVEDILDEFDMEVEIDELFVEDELELVGENEISTSVAGIDIPGAYAYTVAGAGYETQYLREIEAGGGADAGGEFDPPPSTEPINGDEPGPGEPGDIEDPDGDDEEPPLTVAIEAICAQETAQALVELRDEDETFDVTVGELVFDDMELHDFERELTGDQPYAYDCRIETREWREEEVDDDILGDEEDADEETVDDPDAIEDLDDWDENGTPGDPEDISIEEGTDETIGLDDGTTMSDVNFDVPEDSTLTIQPDNSPDWAIVRVGIGGGGTGEIVGRGSGRIRRLYMDGGPDGITLDTDDIWIEDSAVVPASTRASADLERGITLVDGSLADDYTPVPPDPTHPDDPDYSPPPPSSEPEEYEVIEIPRNTHETFFVRSGETFENKIIDVSADGAHCQINARHETDWTIRNIGFRGIADDGTFITVSETNPNGESTIENVYLGDGTVAGHRTGLGVYVGGESRGTVNVHRVFVEGMGDNGFYASGPDEGETHFRDCFAKNNYVAHYRLSSGSVENCVGVTDPDTARVHDRPRFEGRHVWAKTSGSPAEAEVRNCHFVNEGDYPTYVASENSTINVYDTQHTSHRETGAGSVSLESGNGTSPEAFVPQGCPRDAEEAAEGLGAPAP